MQFRVGGHQKLIRNRNVAPEIRLVDAANADDVAVLLDGRIGFKKSDFILSAPFARLLAHTNHAVYGDLPGTAGPDIETSRAGLHVEIYGTRYGELAFEGTFGVIR